MVRIAAAFVGSAWIAVYGRRCSGKVRDIVFELVEIIQKIAFARIYVFVIMRPGMNADDISFGGFTLDDIRIFLGGGAHHEKRGVNAVFL